MADPHDDRLDRRRFGAAGLQTLLAAAGAALLPAAATAAGATAGAGATAAAVPGQAAAPTAAGGADPELARRHADPRVELARLPAGQRRPAGLAVPLAVAWRDDRRDAHRQPARAVRLRRLRDQEGVPARRRHLGGLVEGDDLLQGSADPRDPQRARLPQPGHRPHGAGRAERDRLAQPDDGRCRRARSACGRSMRPPRPA